LALTSRGVVPATIGNFPGQASYYLAYETAQEAMTKLLPNGESKFVTFARGFVSGMAAEVNLLSDKRSLAEYFMCLQIL
jgi:hypothetical protein